jgi:hypothetical protein
MISLPSTFVLIPMTVVMTSCVVEITIHPLKLTCSSFLKHSKVMIIFKLSIRILQGMNKMGLERKMGSWLLVPGKRSKVDKPRDQVVATW